MRKALIIARKEIISTFRQRNLILLMILSPIVLVTIMGLAFSGLGGDTPDFADIPIAVVNLDRGALGSRVAAILRSEPVTAPLSAALGLAAPCPLLSPTAAPVGSLDTLFDAVALDDADAARAQVLAGELAAAVIIPPDFTAHLTPAPAADAAASLSATGTVEVFAGSGTPIAATIVRAVVDGVVGPLVRGRVAWDALRASLSPASLTLAPPDTAAALACLWTPEVGSIRLQPHALDAPETDSPFAAIMVVLGSAQAIFFALFTGVFGINAIYEDRIQGTLQRLIVTPTPRSAILAGRLLGNLGVVMAQLLILLLAFTTMTTLVEREWTFIWGNHPLALLGVVLALSLFTTGLGVLIVGLARSSEQVQVIGPLITIGLSALSGAFGFALPAAVARVSPIWWGVDALRKLASGEPDIGLHLLVLFAIGGLFAALGTFFFRRRMEL